MNITELQQNLTIQYCFPNNNASCRKVVRATSGNVFLTIVLSCVSVCTVFLNILVIISISHFKQLHTPTNMVILSLAVADLIVGLIIMPVKITELIDKCWYFGKVACSFFPLISSLSISASVCNMVFIAVDRYIAVTDPLLYSTKVTLCKMSLIISFGWSYSLLYVVIILYFNDQLFPSQTYATCDGECLQFIKYAWGIVDLFFFFIAPCSIIIILYSIIFKVARRQAKAVRAVTRNKVSKSPETKAAKTLGIVVFIYVACWIPFYLSYLPNTNTSSLSVIWEAFSWLMCINSSLNPLIYAIFYSWFRVSTMHIIKCRILQSSSSQFNLFEEHLQF